MHENLSPVGNSLSRPLEFRKNLLVVVQTLGIFQGVAIRDRPAVHDIRDRAFHFLHVECVWDLRYLEDEGWNVSWRGFFSERFSDLFFQSIRQGNSRPKLHKEDDPLIPLPILSDDQTVRDFFQSVQGIVDFGRTDAHS